MAPPLEMCTRGRACGASSRMSAVHAKRQPVLTPFTSAPCGMSAPVSSKTLRPFRTLSSAMHRSPLSCAWRPWRAATGAVRCQTAAARPEFVPLSHISGVRGTEDLLQRCAKPREAARTAKPPWPEPGTRRTPWRPPARPTGPPVARLAPCRGDELRLVTFPKSERGMLQQRGAIVVRQLYKATTRAMSLKAFPPDPVCRGGAFHATPAQSRCGHAEQGSRSAGHGRLRPNRASSAGPGA